VLLAAGASAGAATAAYGAAGVTPQVLAGIDIRPSPRASLPIATRFRDEHGQRVQLGDYLAGRPAIVVFGYYGCSNLCSVVLQGLASGLTDAGLHAGIDADVVVISIAPQETPAAALQKKQAVLGRDTAGDAAGWHFLTGDEPAIDAVTHAAGYAYAYDAGQRQYAHPAGILVVGDAGRIMALLPGVAFPPSRLRASLSGAASARVDTAIVSDAAPRWLACFHYDPHTGRYSFAAMNAARLAGLCALAALAAFVVRARLREVRGLRVNPARGRR
jgi:protein SCO1/2